MAFLKGCGIVVGALFGLYILVGIFMSCNDPNSDKRSHSRLAIEECWKEQARKSLTPAEQRFIAGTCEMMEAKFIKEYGMKP